MVSNNRQARARRALIYATVGAFVGTAWGAWSLASRGPERLPLRTQAIAPSPPACPLGYATAPQYDHHAIVDSSDIRWIVRCEPLHNDSVISETLELFWVPEILSDPRTRPEALHRFVRTLAQSSRIALEPLTTPQRSMASPQDEALTVDARGGFRLPSLRVRGWTFPAGGHTLLITLIAPEEQMTDAEAAAVTSVTSISGLRAFSQTDLLDRGWTVQATCPRDWTDATEATGGPSRSMYVGRYCLGPASLRGAELTFAEVTSRAQNEHGARQLFALAATMMHAVGTDVRPTQTAGDAGSANAATAMTTPAEFAAPTAVNAAGVSGYTATATIEPPAAEVSLRAWMASAGDATVYALGISMKGREDPMRLAVTQFAARAGLQRPYSAAVVQQHKSERFKGFVLFPGVLTSVLGALIGWFSSQNSKLKSKS